MSCLSHLSHLLMVWLLEHTRQHQVQFKIIFQFQGQILKFQDIYVKKENTPNLTIEVK